MRRRERLTGFLIIFILLTFSAYSNSMNVGGRLGLPSNVNHGQTVESNNRSTSKNTLSNTNPVRQKNIEEKSIENRESKITESSIDITYKINKNEETAVRNNIEDQLIEKSIDPQRDQEKILKSVRDQDQAKDQKDEKAEAEKTAFEKRHEAQLIDQVKVHKVSSGETLWDIAHKHGLNIDSLIGANNISNMNSIKPGQEFKILPIKGIMYRVSPGESVGSIARKFDLSSETIMQDNNIEDSSKLKIDQRLILRGAKPEFSYQDRLDQKFMYPINTRITSYYGPRWGRIHEGLDFAAPMGSPIRAVSSGRVVYSGWATGYGYVVIVEHQRGLRTLYAHNSKLLVREGESVGKGEVISRSGNTGNSTGPHLHFEVQVNGRPENPLGYINK